LCGDGACYLVAKCAALMAYYALLQHLGLGLAFKFASFHVLTPAVKYFRFNRLETLRDKRLFALSLVCDLCMSSIYYGLCIPRLHGPLFVTFPFGITGLMALLEVAQHRLLHSHTPYEMFLSDRLLDYLNVPVFAAAFVPVGRYVDFAVPPRAATFPVFLLSALIFDTGFAFLHYLSHTDPRLWKRHVVHHGYRKERLCVFANFYADVADSFMMAVGFFALAFFVCCVGTDYVASMEVFLMAALSHHRYGGDQLNLMYFFEWDLIDDVFGRPRNASYHGHHHNAANEHFGAFGFVSDDFIKRAFGHYPTTKGVGGAVVTAGNIAAD